MVITLLLCLALLGAPICFAQDGAQRFADLGRCVLESGKAIEPCRLGYRIYGDIDAHPDKAVMGLVWYNGVSADLKGQIFGPEAMVDTRRFVGIAVDAFGDGVSSSPSNSAAQHGADFPQFTIRDMVSAEYRLGTEVLKLKKLYGVIGISMGGMQVFEWVASHPEFVTKAVAIVGTPRQSSFDLLHWKILVEAIESDPGYRGGRYTVEPDLLLANKVGQLSGMSPGYFVRKIPPEEFDQFYAKLSTPSRLDANDRVWQTNAMIAQDVFETGHPSKLPRPMA